MTKAKAIVVFAILGVLILMGAIFAFVSLDNGELGVYDYKAFPRTISLGLDMKGGVYAVFEANTADRDDNFSSRMDGTVEQLSKMLYDKGYTEATVGKVGEDRIRVEVPDVSDPETLFTLIGTPSSLEFRTEGKDDTFTDDGLWVTGKDLANAYVSVNEDNEYVIALQFDAEGTKKFAEATTELNGKALNIWINGDLVMGPTVNSVISDGRAIITSSEWAQSYTTANEYVTKLLAGAFDVELKLVESREISATLGDNALSTSLIIGAIAIAIIILLLILLYRMLGVASGIALIYYIITYVFILSVFPWVQLTLAGIAGVLISIGMAVDANVIIFSRIKDEYRSGTGDISIQTAVTSGFKKSISAIMDGNVTTLLGCLVMYLLGTSAIKSFALTLAIGILISIFTALVVTRLLVNGFLTFNRENPKLYNLYNKFKEEAAAERSAAALAQATVVTAPVDATVDTSSATEEVDESDEPIKTEEVTDND
ncbi:MAG: SecD/SecF family protein translocase subunit [Clostridia bacterium]|nr:SecD/SecF family protein translocase subunit [Clostridia bacterium]